MSTTKSITMSKKAANIYAALAKSRVAVENAESGTTTFLRAATVAANPPVSPRKARKLTDEEASDIIMAVAEARHNATDGYEERKNKGGKKAKGKAPKAAAAKAKAPKAAKVAGTKPKKAAKSRKAAGTKKAAKKEVVQAKAKTPKTPKKAPKKAAKAPSNGAPSPTLDPVPTLDTSSASAEA